MKALYAEQFAPQDPLAGLCFGDRPEPSRSEGHEIVRVVAASLNRHDLWTLAGVTMVPFDPPVTLGCDGAGIDQNGRAVTIFPVLGHGPKFQMLTDGVDGTLAALVKVPVANVVRKPEGLSFEEAACLGTTWLTAWSALVGRARLQDGERVLVQGVSGGLSNAVIALARALGAHVTATSRTEQGHILGLKLGANEVVAPGTPLADPVDVVIDSVGAKTWGHSLQSLAFGGRAVCLGATSGRIGETHLRTIFANELEIYGHKMGTEEEFRALCDFVEWRDLHPFIGAHVDGLEAGQELFRRYARDEIAGKAVVRVDPALAPRRTADAQM
ncbi:zinc-binding dehydrogenase [Mycolicibacterium pulveris]|uniref:Zn-dependent oxidoreductase n=1 Tax=Mycolicibacterium pulveris TaxID=36813 RepID=A0A7I7UPL7_MYCPV|nr:zinc-binding dehydrogenase [Mycolicibacterium pulveris]MCV6983523.1 zinc-binding dehydrogenase [Mycolicibacterium pulveris]BBY83402.1 Zn-dependent oxidoreductase [Mycolicibacterium pulveris]